MSIRELFEKIKSYEKELFISILIIIVGFFSFGLGRLSKIVEERVPVKIEFPNERAVENPNYELSGNLVGSKKGSKYHFPWCPGAMQMNEENKIYFKSKEDAVNRGYSPASNCKGL